MAADAEEKDTLLSSHKDENLVLVRSQSQYGAESDFTVFRQISTNRSLISLAQGKIWRLICTSAGNKKEGECIFHCMSSNLRHEYDIAYMYSQKVNDNREDASLTLAAPSYPQYENVTKTLVQCEATEEPKNYTRSRILYISTGTSKRVSCGQMFLNERHTSLFSNITEKYVNAMVYIKKLQLLWIATTQLIRVYPINLTFHIYAVRRLAADQNDGYLFVLGKRNIHIRRPGHSKMETILKTKDTIFTFAVNEKMQNIFTFIDHKVMRFNYSGEDKRVVKHVKRISDLAYDPIDECVYQRSGKRIEDLCSMNTSFSLRRYPKRFLVLGKIAYMSLLRIPGILILTQDGETKTVTTGCPVPITSDLELSFLP